eukprot:3895829-Amphidinium_carterae.5
MEFTPARSFSMQELVNCVPNPKCVLFLQRVLSVGACTVIPMCGFDHKAVQSHAHEECGGTGGCEGATVELAM